MPVKTKATKKRAAPKKAQPVGTMLLMRTCGPDGGSHGGFRWPLTVGAEVVCPNWKNTKACGNGLHGLPWGVGDGNLLSWDPSAVWLVWEAVAADVVDIDGAKSKAPRGIVRFVGAREEAARFILDNGAAGKAVVGAVASAGYRGTASAGYRGTASAGDRGTASAGDRGTASAGYGGTASAGDGGTASAGDGGTASAGDRGTASAGDRGTILQKWWDGSRYRIAVGYVGEAGIEAGKKYRCEYGKLVEAA